MDFQELNKNRNKNKKMNTDINELKGIEQNQERENKNITLILNSMRQKENKEKVKNAIKLKHPIIKLLEERGIF